MTFSFSFFFFLLRLFSAVGLSYSWGGNVLTVCPLGVGERGERCSVYAGVGVAGGGGEVV